MNMRDKIIMQNDDLISANEKLQQTNEELEETNEELQTSLQEIEDTNRKLEVTKETNELLIYNMKERMKELQCLYNVANIIETHQPLNEILNKIIDEIPPAFQYPEITTARIIYGDRIFTSNNFKETEWCLSSNIRVSKKQVGKIDVFYLERKPACYKGPFFKEEISLVDSIAKRVGKLIEAMQSDNDLKNYINFMETFIDTIPNPVFSKDENGVYTNCNKAFSEKILGLPKDQIIGKTLFDFANEKIPKEFVDEYYKRDVAILGNKGLQIYESPVKCSDNVLRNFVFYKSTFDKLDGSIGGIVGIMVDITQQKEIEQELKHSEEKYKAIVEDQTELICRYLAMEH
jgi:PAS domain S-box-containing protein